MRACRTFRDMYLVRRSLGWNSCGVKERNRGCRCFHYQSLGSRRQVTLSFLQLRPVSSRVCNLQQLRVIISC